MLKKVNGAKNMNRKVDATGGKWHGSDMKIASGQKSLNNPAFSNMHLSLSNKFMFIPSPYVEVYG
jgi:hypothetical protein